MSPLRLRGFIGVASALAMATTVFIAGCSDDTVKPPNEFAPPSSLTFRNFQINSSSGGVQLTWNLSPDDSGNFSEFAGYNVYRDTASMTNLDASELATKLIMSLDAGTSTYTDGTGVLGTKYFYGVRARRDNGDVSVSSNEVDTARIVAGTLASIAEYAASGPSGFNVALGRAFSVMPANADSIDFYLGTLDDTASGALLLKSPSLISDSPPWNTRVTGFKLLDSDASSTTTTGFDSSIVLGTTNTEIEDKIIAVKLAPNFLGETHYAKVEILIFNDGGSGNRSVQLTWHYQPIPAYARF